MLSDEQVGIVIFADESFPVVTPEEIKEFINQLNNHAGFKKYFLRRLFNFPKDWLSVEIHDWQVVNYMKRKVFTRENGKHSLGESEKLKYFFVTTDKDFLEDARDLYLEHSKSKKVPSDIELIQSDNEGKIIFSKKICRPGEHEHRLFKIVVSIIYLTGGKRKEKLKEVFNFLKWHLEP